MSSQEPGIQYLREIGFQKITGRWGLLERWKKEFGIAKGNKVWEEYIELCNSSLVGKLSFYEWKNSDIRISKALNEYYDDEVVRKACNYISNHKRFFGKTILEVGCDIGYMTGFLAKTFPDSKIVSIDRCKSAVEFAKSKITSMGITNVEFRVCDVSEIANSFDTVFAMRTLHENELYTPFNGDPLDYQIYSISTVYNEYLDKLVACTKHNGTLCIIQEDVNGLFVLGMSLYFQNKKLTLDLSTIQKFSCNNKNWDGNFAAFICINDGNCDNTVYDTEYSSCISTLYKKEYQSGEKVLYGIEALSYLSSNAGELIRGFHVVDADKRTIGRFALFYDKNGKDYVFFLYANGEVPTLTCEKTRPRIDNIMSFLDDIARSEKNAGHDVIPIDPNKDCIEGVS